jgi:hypothetical protein
MRLKWEFGTVDIQNQGGGMAMKEKHCKDVVENLFDKKDPHFQFEEEIEPLPELESMNHQQAMENHRLRKTQKSGEVD